MNTGKGCSGIWKRENSGIDIGDVDRRQITDSRIRISVFYQFMTRSFSSSKWMKYSYDCGIFTIHSFFYSFLCQTWTDIIHDNRIWSYLWIRFQCVSCSVDVRNEYGSIISRKGSQYLENIVYQLCGNVNYKSIFFGI